LTGDRLVGVFLLGLLLFMPPLIGAFDVRGLLVGIPLLYLYLYFAWALLIVFVALIVELPEPDDQSAEGSTRPDVGQAPDARSGR
jgi:hypothetical protein